MSRLLMGLCAVLFVMIVVTGIIWMRLPDEVIQRPVATYVPAQPQRDKVNGGSEVIEYDSLDEEIAALGKRIDQLLKETQPRYLP